MKNRTLILLWATCVWSTEVNAVTDRPIIGILAQDAYEIFSKKDNSYIVASYVKYIESAGARVVPIFINQTRDYYTNIFNAVNGVLIPGGGANLDTSGYGKAGKILYNLAIVANQKGDYFPVWGTCLGFELLTYLAANGTSWMKSCWTQDLALSLKISEGYKKSRIFKAIPSDVMKYVTSLPVAINYHKWCLTPENFTKSGLNETFQILSTNKDTTGITFISTIEAWHPEKNLFEWVNTKSHHNIPHTAEAIRVGQHFANFFVGEARKNNHKFPSTKEEASSLIYNYNPEYVGIEGSNYQQVFFFKSGLKATSP
ncbi:gamma-glutamyl hydrolase-like isoform X2 [Limulus polyphemus]|uniref:folate gamma-glutamyl hydrolase n=1 Tax=Limulus polyphemus TaxID=6850 RepID=A0ABM1BFM6_LIMPO|nr:gamma-glutamyl hydrolase-like isoform X2 [Limulus polyphemus]